MTLPEGLKLTHVTCAFLSIAGFALRGYWMATDNPLLQRRPAKVLPHLLDTVLLGSANRDERQWERAADFDVTRLPQGHVAFGYGIHFCLGASLARLEARVALETLVPLLKDRELCPGGGVRTDSFFTRGFAKLEIARLDG